MISSLQSTVSNNTRSIKYDHNPLSSTDIQINLKETMSISETSNNQPKINQEEEEEEDDDDDNNNNEETSRLVSIKIENDQEQTSVMALRSILRKRNEKKISIDDFRDVQHTSISMNEDDSDYTGDESEENDDKEEKESNASNRSIEEKSENNEQEQHRRYYNYSRHQQKKKNQFFRTSPSTPLDFPLRAETGTTTTSLPPQTTFYTTDQSLTRTACVTFTKDQPIIIHRSSSTPQLGGADLQPRTSITYINMREDLSASIPITTTATQATTLMTEFRPVYVSPLKYRPLVGLSANDNRLLLEKRVSLLGKPLILHPIQKRSPTYRRNQLRIYNFLERPHGCQAVIYHSFV